MKKKLAMAVAAVMTLSLVGCGSKAAVTQNSTAVTEEAASIQAESTVESTQPEEEMSVQDEVTIGKVAAIDGDTITVALGKMNLAEVTGGDRSESEAPGGDKLQGEAASGNKPEGESPSGDNKGMPFKESGETITITPDDTVTILVQNGENTTEGTIDDIAESSIISIIYDADGNVTSIEVMGRGGDKALVETDASMEETTTEE